MQKLNVFFKKIICKFIHFLWFLCYPSAKSNILQKTDLFPWGSYPQYPLCHLPFLSLHMHMNAMQCTAIHTNAYSWTYIHNHTLEFTSRHANQCTHIIMHTLWMSISTHANLWIHIDIYLGNAQYKHQH